MLTIDTRELERVDKRMRAELTFLPFFRTLRFREPQERYFLGSPGVDGGRTFSTATFLQRFRRTGYYRRQPRQGAQPRRPYGVWTGNTLDHTTEEKARVTVRPGVMTLQHRLTRNIRRYWDDKDLDRWLEAKLEAYFQTVLEGRRLSLEAIAVEGG